MFIENTQNETFLCPAFLFGPRGAGKTKLSTKFLAEQKLSGRSTFEIDLLSLKQQGRYLNAPELFRTDLEYQLQKCEGSLLVFIDEIQKIPSLLDEVHYFLEAELEKKVQFLLTGSSARKLRRGGANLLAGRVFSLSLHPLSQMDIQLNLERALQYGTLPGLYFAEQNVDLLLESYVETYLKEEIQSERLVRALAPFQRFLSLAAQMNGQLINFSEC